MYALEAVVLDMITLERTPSWEKNGRLDRIPAAVGPRL